MKNISVIIPCYNTEKYIEKCIDSILNQTYKNIEIILIDDLSTDNTYNIISSYAEKHKNIIAIQNKKNSGAAYSRNIALKHAKYELISFIDSDDYIDSNYYESMIKLIEKDNSDIVVCDICTRYDESDDECITKACKNRNDKYSYIDNGLSASPCNKIFKKADLLKYPFPEGIMNEDIATVLPIMIYANKISYNEDTLYNYIQRKDSVQNSKLNEKRFDLFKSLDILEQRVERNEKNKKYWDAIIYNQVISFLFYYLTKEKKYIKRRKYLKIFNNLSKKYNIQDNPLLDCFYDRIGKKHKLYYRYLLLFNTKGFYDISNEIIAFYHFYIKLRKNVIKKYITISDIVDLSKYQHNLKDSDVKISVIIPNYNYEKFLLQRIYSILYQKEKIFEIIILDDKSRDNSRELINEIYNKIKDYINIRTIYNNENSGTAFKQWKKGFEQASGDYVWIAEADDYCSNKFLKNVVKPIRKNKKIVISYSNTSFIDKDGYIVMKSIIPEIDQQKTGHWNNDYINNGLDEIHNYAYLNCTIANVSSVLFKKDNYLDYFEKSSKFKQAGDWMFYIYVMSTGEISYINKHLNYYRIHGSNVTSQTKKKNHLEEIKKVHKEIDKEFNLDDTQKKNIKSRYKYLEDTWRL